jgi:heme O synthase-like polyprenyltransferase
VRATAGHKAWWIFVHVTSTALAALLLAVSPALGWWYLAPTDVITGLMVAGSINLIRTPERKQAIHLFVLSNLFLLLVLVAVVLAATGHQLFAL